MSRVTCHMSLFKKYIYKYNFFYKLVKLVGGGSVINGAYPLQLIYAATFFQHKMCRIIWFVYRFYVIFSQSTVPMRIIGFMTIRSKGKMFLSILENNCLLLHIQFFSTSKTPLAIGMLARLGEATKNGSGITTVSLLGSGNLKKYLKSHRQGGGGGAEKQFILHNDIMHRASKGCQQVKTSVGSGQGFYCGKP